MIVGKGDIASVLNDREGALFFASGVSDSSCVDQELFKRERALLLEQNPKLCCFYFSSIVAEIKDTPYYFHKLEMEHMVRLHFYNYNIIRLGNISWGVNPNTFLNAIRMKIKNNQEVEIRDEYRFMIDEKELLLLTDNLPLVGQNEINVFGRMAKVKDLI